MSAQSKRDVLLALLLAALLVTLFAGSLSAQVRQPFEWIQARRLSVETSAAVGTSLNVGGAATVTGDARVGGNVLATGAVNVGTLLRMTPAATAVIVADGTLTPVGSYQPISSTAAVGTSVIATTTRTAGELLYLINVGSQTVTFTDTGSLKLSGNAALGAGDTLLLVFDGTNWNQAGKTDN